MSAGGFIDNFDVPGLDSGWIVGPGEEHRNDDFWSIDSDAGLLRIITRESDIRGPRNQPGNYFLREVGMDDFEITTRLRFAPRENFENAGLIVWESMDDYIKLVHSFDGIQRLEGALEANGEYSTQRIFSTLGDDLFLRIRKVGREYTYLFSGDGDSWHQLGSRVKADWERPMVGVMAVSPESGRNIPAEFEFFYIAAVDASGELQYTLPSDTAPAQPGPGQVMVPFQNPVYLADFPDPGITRSGEWFYAVATQSFIFNQDLEIPILRSRDLVNWELVGPAVPYENLPAWVNPENPSLWAPDMIYREDLGKHFLYFSALGDIGHGIGVGWADSPEGPFTFHDEPVVIGTHFRNIDSQVLIDDDGSLYMYWGSMSAPLMCQRLADDGFTLIGERSEVILPQDSPVIIDASHGPSVQNEFLIEAPWVIKRGDFYYMFYSGSGFYPGQYSTMVARATSPRGPFNKHGANPILTTNEPFNAPGHNALIQDDAGQDWIVYHAYLESHLGFGRGLLIDRIDWVDGWPVVNGGRGPSHGWREDGPVINAGRDYQPMRNVAEGANVSASSELEGYPARNVTDGDTFTYWSPACIAEPQWLEIDLGAIHVIDRTQILFRTARGYIHDPRRLHPGRGHVDQYYFYRIEHSRDGLNWEPYADRTDREFIAYPYIDHNDVTARYLRVTITGSESDQPNKNVYQVMVFGRAESSE